MCELLELSEDDLVLDVGGGSGYHAAVLARLARRVISIERQPELVESGSPVPGCGRRRERGDDLR